MNRFTIMRHIKSLKKPAMPKGDWLAENREKLLAFMQLHPAMDHSQAFSNKRSPLLLFRVGGVAVIILALTTTSITYAAQSAIPGDILFPVKKASERAALAIPLSTDSRSSLGLSFAKRRLDELSELKDRNMLSDTIIEDQISEYQELISSASETAQSEAMKDKEHALALMLNIEHEVGLHKGRTGHIDKKIADSFEDKNNSVLQEIEDSATDFEIDLGIIGSASVRNINTKGAEERIKERIDRSEQELEHIAEFHGETMTAESASLNEAKIKKNEKKMKEALEVVKKLEQRIKERSKKNERSKEGRRLNQAENVSDSDNESSRGSVGAAEITIPENPLINGQPSLQIDDDSSFIEETPQEKRGKEDASDDNTRDDD